MNDHITGNGKKWLLGLAGLLVTPAFGVVAGWVTAKNANDIRHSEKIAVIETQIADTRIELRRINDKLDKLLERERRN